MKEKTDTKTEEKVELNNKENVVEQSKDKPEQKIEETDPGNPLKGNYDFGYQDLKL